MTARTMLGLLSVVIISIPDVHAQSEVDQLKARVAMLEGRLDEMQKELLKLTGSPSAPLTQAASAATSSPPPQAPAEKKHDRQVASRSTIQQNENSVARVDNVPIDPELKGFFRIPGTDAMMQIGGYAKADFIFDPKYAGQPDFFQPSSFPLAAPYTSASTNVNIRQTRLTEEIRRDVLDSPLRFYLESDFYGETSTSFHLRQAYAQWRNFLIGQTWSLIDDIDTFPDSLDFNGPVGILLSRNPQFRYTQPLGQGASLAFSIEKPAPDVQTTVANTSITPTSLTPDFVARYRQDSEWGHWQSGVIFRSVGGFAPSTGVAHVLGVGGTVSAVVRFHGKDNVAFQATIGKGISNIILDQEGQQLDAGFNSNRQMAATPAGGGHVAYQHQWSAKWRSSLVYSYARANNLASDPASAYHASHYMLGNLLWSPIHQPLTLGAELLYGRLVRRDLSTYSAPRIQLSAQYSFFK